MTDPESTRTPPTFELPPDAPESEDWPYPPNPVRRSQEDGIVTQAYLEERIAALIEDIKIQLRGIDPIKARMEAKVRRVELTEELEAHGAIVSDKKHILKSMTIYPLAAIFGAELTALIQSIQLGNVETAVQSGLGVALTLFAFYGRFRKGDLSW